MKHAKFGEHERDVRFASSNYNLLPFDCSSNFLSASYPDTRTAERTVIAGIIENADNNQGNTNGYLLFTFFLQTLKIDYSGALARIGAPWGRKMVTYRCKKFW